MHTYLYIEINVIALLIITLIYSNLRHKPDSLSIDLKLFNLIMLLTGVILIADTGMWILDGTSYYVTRGLLLLSTLIYYILQPIICMLWSLYVDYGINHDRARLKKYLFIISIPAVINAILSLISCFTNYFFYFDQSYHYHRGNLFMYASILCFIYPIYTFIYVISNRKRVYTNFYHSFLIFVVPPFLGAIIQIIFFGLALIWIGMALSILIVFINYQNEQMYMDFLTGLFNRRQLDFYLQDQINKKNKYIAGIMIDLNAFKQINDKFGHTEGDKALINTSRILKNTFGPKAFIARYGGDEFVVLLEVHNHENLEAFINSLNNQVELFNSSNSLPYTISLSIGADLYHNHSTYNSHAFLNHIDNLMYQNKKLYQSK